MNSEGENEKLALLMLEVLPKAMQSIREEMRQGRGEQLTVPQFRILAAINRGFIHNKALGEHLGVSEAAASRMTHFLCKEGFVKKAVEKKDRRQKGLKLTMKGEKLLTNIKISALDRLKQKFHTLEKKDVMTAMAGLQVLQTYFIQA